MCLLQKFAVIRRRFASPVTAPCHHNRSSRFGLGLYDDRRFVVLLLTAILTQPLRTVGDLAPGHRIDYQRVLSRAPWSGLRPGCTLARLILDRLHPRGPVFLVGDDTVDGHPGRCLYGKARHRDPVRSSHAYTAREYGHRRVVLAVLVRLPGTSRPWALPVIVDLYRSEEDDRRRGRPHRTPARLMCRLLRALMMEFPGRRSVFVGDSGYGSHEVARLCHRHRSRLSPVSELHPEANLFEPPPPYGGLGRPRAKGAAGPSPARGWRPRGVHGASSLKQS
ncbi:transposase [Singulisphaera sp. PoT]|uniref:transposase n=1 Tax=Singulisphaera sp. PoT TaxID=3411797 RepID=UPI003BF478D3